MSVKILFFFIPVILTNRHTVKQIVSVRYFSEKTPIGHHNFKYLDSKKEPTNLWREVIGIAEMKSFCLSECDGKPNVTFIPQGKDM